MCKCEWSKHINIQEFSFLPETHFIYNDSDRFRVKNVACLTVFKRKLEELY